MTKLSDELRVARRWEKDTTAFVHAADHAEAMSISVEGKPEGKCHVDTAPVASMEPIFLNSNLQ